jgi:uncharacterized protein with GYD domain
MAKYALYFSDTSDTWARMLTTSSDPTAAVREAVESLGGSLESMYWMLGAHDGFVIVDLPDSIRAAALSVTVNATGAFKHLETHELFTQDQLVDILARSREATQVYKPPPG